MLVYYFNVSVITRVPILFCLGDGSPEHVVDYHGYQNNIPAGLIQARNTDYGCYSDGSVTTLSEAIVEDYCRICDMSCLDSEQLEFHMKSVHCDEFSHFCFKCGKGFKSYSGLYDHQRLHHGAGPVCSFCGKNFSRKAHLKLHIKVHHSS